MKEKRRKTMKRKSITTFFAIALMLVLSLSLLTACNKNQHEFSSEWKYDETGHWHECTTKEHTDTSEKADHDFDDGEVTLAPTEQEYGIKTFTCKVCGNPTRKITGTRQLAGIPTQRAILENTTSTRE